MSTNHEKQIGNIQTPWTWELSTEERVKLESDLLSYNGRDKIIPVTDAIQQLIDDPRKDFTARSGIRSLDAATDGFRGGELIVISGPTKAGKTTFCQSLTVAFRHMGVDSLWFSYEIQKREFVKKFPNIPHFYLPDMITSRAINWLDLRILEARIKYNIRAVFIDHLHFLVDMEKMKSPSLEIGTIVRKLKTLANNHDVIIFLISHITKLQPDEEPDITHIRDSAFTSCEADSTFMIYRLKDRNTDNYSNRAVLKICNHRHTGVMNQKINLVMHKGTLKEEEVYYQDVEGDRGRE